MAILSFLVSYAVATTDSPPTKWLSDAVQKTGNAYRGAVTNMLNAEDATSRLTDALQTAGADTMQSRVFRVLLARRQQPDVFAEFDRNIAECRKGQTSSLTHGWSPGILAGRLMLFTKQGPESRYVYERDDVADRNLTNTNRLILRGLHQKKVEKYTDAEVAAGIARNAAARQAVLEHFLKFLDEGDAYEQSELVDLVNRLWGRERLRRTADLAVVDHVQDAEALIEVVFRDESRPAAARMRAAFCLPDDKRQEVQVFMLNVVTNTPADDRGQQSEDMINRALAYLKSSADANTLAVLKTQTNGPAWKREKIEKASHVIEARLSATPKDK